MIVRYNNFSNIIKSFFRIFICSALFCAVFLFANLSSVNAAAEVSEFIPVPEINLIQDQTISDLQITGTAINFSLVEIYLDQEFLGLAQTTIGTQGWQTWSINLPSDLMFGKHILLAQIKYSKHLSQTSQIEFNYSPKFPTPTVFNPVLNSETNFQQPWIVGLTFNNAILDIYIDEKLDGTLEIQTEKNITDFKYKPKQKLSNGFHVIKIKAKSLTGQSSDWSNEIIFEVRQAKTKMQAPDLPNQSNDFVPPVPAPTLLLPTSGQVQTKTKLNVQGLVHNEHYVKIYDDKQLIGEFMPIDHSSGVTNFNWEYAENLKFGLHRIWAECINPRGQISGKSNTLYLIILAPDHFVSSAPVGLIASAKDQELIDISNDILANQIDKTNQKINSWAKRWQWFILIIILLVIILTAIWIFIFKKNKKKNNKIEVKHSEEHTLQGPDIKFENNLNNKSEDEKKDENKDDDDFQKPSPPSANEQKLGI